MKYIIFILILFVDSFCLAEQNDIDHYYNYYIYIQNESISIGRGGRDNIQSVSLKDSLNIIINGTSFNTLKLYSLIDTECSINSLFEFLGKNINPNKLLLQDIKIDTLPANLELFNELNEIRISDNYNINFPATVKNMWQMKKIDYTCYLKDIDSNQIPGNITLFPSLDTLKLSGVTIDENMDFSKCDSLKEMILGQCKIEKIPRSIAYLKCLEVLFLVDCIDLETIPCFIGELPSLRFLLIANPPKAICKSVFENKNILLKIFSSDNKYEIFDSD